MTVEDAIGANVTGLVLVAIICLTVFLVRRWKDRS